MAASPIPGLDVTEGYPIETPRGKVPPAPAVPPSSAEGFADMRGQANPAGAAPGAPPGAGAARPAGFYNPGAADVGTTPGGPSRFGMRNPTTMLQAAGEATKDAISSGAKQVVPAIKSAGMAAKNAIGGGVGNLLVSGAAAAAGHGNFYGDENVPITDKLRVGASDTAATLGSAAGTIFGGAVGSGVPVAGTFAGGLVGGALGLKGGHAIGNAIFDSDATLRRNGFDPDRGVVAVANDLIHGKGGNSFGLREATPGQVTSAMNPLGDASRGAPQPALAPTATATPTASAPPGSTVVPDSQLPPLPGREVPGASGVRRIDNPGQNPSYTDGSSTSGTLGTVPGYSTEARAVDERNSALQAGMRDTQRQLDAYGPGGQGGGAASSLGGDSIAAHNAATDRSVQLDAIERGMKSGNPQQRAAATMAYAQLAGQGQGSKDQLAIEGMRQRGETMRANSANALAAQGQQLSSADHRYTADQGLRGHMAQRAFEASKFNAELAQKDREFTAGRQDHNDVQKTAREAALQKNIEATTVNPDGTPNAAAAADYRRGIDRSVARLGANGVHELSPVDEQRLYAASDLLKTMKSNTSNWNPFKPDQLKTIDPVDLTNLRRLPNGDRQITAKGRAFGQTIPKRFFDTEEGVRMYGGTKTNKYDMLEGQ